MLKLSTTLAVGLWIVVLGPLGLQDPGRGSVAGSVSVNGEAAPGAKIQVVGATQASAVTNEEGLR